MLCHSEHLGFAETGERGSYRAAAQLAQPELRPPDLQNVSCDKAQARSFAKYSALNSHL